MGERAFRRMLTSADPVIIPEIVVGRTWFQFASVSNLANSFLKPASLAPRETENNDYAKFWDEKQRALWYVMVFSGVVNC